MKEILHTKAARLLSLMLALMMVFTVCSAGVLAESAEGTSENPAAAAPNVTLPSPSSTFYIYDEEEVLEVATKTAILTRNGTLYEKYGMQIVVLTLKEIPGADINAKGNYLHQIIDSWQIGGTSEKCLVLALSVAQQDYVAVAGNGLSAAFPVDTWSTLFTQSLEPKFSAGEYDAGVLEFFTAIADKAEQYAMSGGMTAAEASAEPSAAPEETEEDKKEEGEVSGFAKFLRAIGMLIFIVLVILIVGFIVIYVHGQMVLKKRREARRRRAMQARAQQNERQQTRSDNDLWNRY